MLLFYHNADATPLASISPLSQSVKPVAAGATSQSTPATASCKLVNHISVCEFT